MNAFKEELRHDYSSGELAAESDEMKDYYGRLRFHSGWNDFFVSYGSRPNNLPS